ncbi:MAG: hypothetical protein VKI42_07820 [Synechococcaceae cyanobacterium]|nr:hypothetical protein [Synechococcaceae cyanobacterium]
MHHSQRLKQGLCTVRGVRGQLEGARLDQHSTTAVADLHHLSRSLLTLALQAPLMAAPEGTIGRLVEECRRKWLGNPGQIQYCIQQQNLNYQRVQRSGASAETLNECKASWGDDYGMVMACLRNPPIRSSRYQQGLPSRLVPQRATPATAPGPCVSWLMVGSKKQCF